MATECIDGTESSGFLSFLQKKYFSFCLPYTVYVVTDPEIHIFKTTWN